MSARERVLAAVRSGLASSGSRPRDPAAVAAEAAALLADPDAIRPRLVAAALPDAFAAKATAIGCTLDRIAGIDALPAAVARYLSSQGLAPSVALAPAPRLAVLDWDGIATHASIAADEPAAVGIARWGIAESGSFVIHSGPDTPILLAFLPLHHIVVLCVADILAHLEDYAALAEGIDRPRNAILITGPSGTTDIEGSYVRGAHGPGFVHVILVDGAS